MDGTDADAISHSSTSTSTSTSSHPTRLHHSWLYIQQAHSQVALDMMQYLMTASTILTPVSLQETLTAVVMKDRTERGAVWTFYTAICQDTFHTVPQVTQGRSGYLVTVRHGGGHHQRQQQQRRADDVAIQYSLGIPYSTEHGEPCCQVWSSSATEQASYNSLPVLVLLHSTYLGVAVGATTSTPPPPLNNPTDADQNPLPFLLQRHPVGNTIPNHVDFGMSVTQLPYIATIREVPILHLRGGSDARSAPSQSSYAATPNFADLLMRQHCAPPTKNCYQCLKQGITSSSSTTHDSSSSSNSSSSADTQRGDCQVCADMCRCYCQALCAMRPPPKRLAATWTVTLPRYRIDPDRLIPRLVHQADWEPNITTTTTMTVAQDAEPSRKRLIESFRQSGWTYTSYDSHQAAQFLSAHFPPQVRQAYDAVRSTTVKADLFRYCVIFIRGGVYADSDVLLESNLDDVVNHSIGFTASQDSPGVPQHHHLCLWNGFLTAAPGHVFLAQTIQNVVNNIRNRFVPVDWDSMLCPNPILSLSRPNETHYMSGSCMLGASLNDVLRRHRQSSFDAGEIDLLGTERNKLVSGSSTATTAILLDRFDPRLLISGQSVILHQNKDDMGAHRITNVATNVIVAVTDILKYNLPPRPLSFEQDHTTPRLNPSWSSSSAGQLHTTGEYTGDDPNRYLYHDAHRANEEISILIHPSDGTNVNDWI
jgi:Glycosyltransferase sugar-binding region containing DXD motif